MIHHYAVERSFDLRLCVTSGQVFRWAENFPNQWLGVDGDHWYEVDALPTSYRVRSNANEDSFRELFDLNLHESEGLRRLLGRGPELRELVDCAAGLRMMRPSCPVEATFSFLCTSNNHLARITAMVDHLAQYGPDLRPGGPRRFPSLEVLAGLTEATLRSHGFGYRAATIPRAAQSLLALGPDPMSLLASLPDDALRETLLGLPGVGPKLADCILIYAFHQRRVAPVDTHVWNIAVPLYFPEWLGSAPTEARKRVVSKFLVERFGEDAAWAQQILFARRLMTPRRRRREP